MFRLFVVLYCSVFAAALAVVLVGPGLPRVIVVPPLKDRVGGTLIVRHDVQGFGSLDSAEAYCERCMMEWDKCRRDMTGRIGANDVYVSLPYSEMLFGMTGASTELWKSVPDYRRLDEPSL